MNHPEVAVSLVLLFTQVFLISGSSFRESGNSVFAHVYPENGGQEDAKELLRAFDLSKSNRRLPYDEEIWDVPNLERLNLQMLTTALRGKRGIPPLFPPPRRYRRSEFMIPPLFPPSKYRQARISRSSKDSKRAIPPMFPPTFRVSRSANDFSSLIPPLFPPSRRSRQARSYAGVFEPKSDAGVTTRESYNKRAIPPLFPPMRRRYTRSKYDDGYPYLTNAEYEELLNRNTRSGTSSFIPPLFPPVKRSDIDAEISSLLYGRDDKSESRDLSTRHESDEEVSEGYSRDSDASRGSEESRDSSDDARPFTSLSTSDRSNAKRFINRDIRSAMASLFPPLFPPLKRNRITRSFANGYSHLTSAQADGTHQNTALTPRKTRSSFIPPPFPPSIHSRGKRDLSSSGSKVESAIPPMFPPNMKRRLVRDVSRELNSQKAGTSGIREDVWRDDLDVSHSPSLSGTVLLSIFGAAVLVAGVALVGVKVARQRSRRTQTHNLAA